MTPEQLTKQQDFAAELLRLMTEHPTLPVISMVNTDVCNDNSYTYKAGRLGEPKLDRTHQDKERIYFESIDFDSLAEQEFNRLEIANKRTGTERTMIHARNNVAAFDWKPVITLSIDLPA